MKKYVIATALVSLSTAVQAMAACPYTLDATAAQIVLLQGPPQKFSSVNLTTQRVLKTITASSAPPAAGAFMAGNTAGVAKLLSFELNPATVALGEHELPSHGIIAL